MKDRPRYNQLYKDMIRDKYPEKEDECNVYLSKSNWTALDVMKVNSILFDSRKSRKDKMIDKKHRAYDEASIKEMLKYQRDNKLNDVQLANVYGMSRNTVAKWKKAFNEQISILD